MFFCNSTYLGSQTFISSETDNCLVTSRKPQSIQSSHSLLLTLFLPRYFNCGGLGNLHAIGRQHLFTISTFLGHMLHLLLTYLAGCFNSLSTNHTTSAAKPRKLHPAPWIQGLCWSLASFLSGWRGLSDLLDTLSHFCNPLQYTENFLYSSTQLQRQGNSMTEGCQLFSV